MLPNVAQIKQCSAPIWNEHNFWSSDQDIYFQLQLRLRIHTLDCLIQALVRIAILLYLIPFKWCEYKTPCSPLKKHGANRRHGVLNRKKPILISLAWCTFFKNTGGNIKQNFDMLYQFQKKWCEYKAWCSFSKINGAIKRHDVLFQKILVWIGWHDVLFKICLIRAPVLQLGRRE